VTLASTCLPSALPALTCSTQQPYPPPRLYPHDIISSATTRRRRRRRRIACFSANLERVTCARPSHHPAKSQLHIEPISITARLEGYFPPPSLDQSRTTGASAEKEKEKEKEVAKQQLKGSVVANVSPPLENTVPHRSSGYIPLALRHAAQENTLMAQPSTGPCWNVQGTST
jgi:hypothetical protein